MYNQYNISRIVRKRREILLKEKRYTGVYRLSFEYMKLIEILDKLNWSALLWVNRTPISMISQSVVNYFPQSEQVLWMALAHSIIEWTS